MSHLANSTGIKEPSVEEQDLLEELIRALRSIRYGSVVLTVHDGRLVEIHKTEKIRRIAKERQE